MKLLNREDIITYENNKEYVVIDSLIIDDDNFVYLIQKDDPKNQLFARVVKEDDKLRIDELDTSAEENKEVIEELLKGLLADMYDDLEKEGIENGSED